MKAILICLLSAVCASPAAEPLRALMITGGCCHEYDQQKNILSEGVSARANVTWKIAREGGNATKHKVSLYEQANWAEGFDIVVHNECFADVKENDWVERIVKPHREGIPAVVIHCAMHCYRAPTNEWFKFLGVTSHRHGSHFPFEVKNLKAEHPIMKGFPESWKAPKEELYNIAKVWPDATPLGHAHSHETKNDEVCIWINTYGKGRVFGTTIGHYSQTMREEIYLDLITRGLLWACDRLDADGKPKAGFGKQ